MAYYSNDQEPNVPKKKDLSFRKTFNRGYSEVRQRVEKGSKYTMSCYNCEYYYQAVGDKTEVCQNPEVLKYDMVVTETSIYCTKWKLAERASTTPTKSVKGLFKRR